ncbi:MAG: hypothetical protein RI958_1724 [Actinomycetota bacterium]
MTSDGDDMFHSKASTGGHSTSLQDDTVGQQCLQGGRISLGDFHLVADSATLRNMTQASGVETLRATDRGLSLIRAIADHPQGLALTDLARVVGLSPSTTLRQARALETARFAVRRLDGSWIPGPELLRIARSLSANATLPRLAEPVLATLAERTGESAYLAEAVDSTWAVYVAMQPGRHSIRHVSWLGHTVPRRDTAVGRALDSVVDVDGVAVRRDTVELGITAVSAPVRDTSGLVVGALSVVGPSFRLCDELLATTRTAVGAHAAELSRLAGYPPTSDPFVDS